MSRSQSAFTLIELMTVIVIIGILAVMLFPVVEGIRSRAQRAGCIANLKNLYVGASGYILRDGCWPQIDTTLIRSREYDRAWIKALAPYNISRETWICPTIQYGLQGVDFNKPENARIDYIATPFDSKPNTPYKWSTQPWFIERADSHGRGNLMIFANGSVRELSEFRQSYGK